ncbi:MAG TPA: DUF5107 domain-containing protein [Anaerolineaceae bacterium]
MTELRLQTLTLPGCPLGAENPLPIFRDPAFDRPIIYSGEMPPEKRRYFGWQAGRRVLPYRMQEIYDRRRVPYSMKTAILENEILRATFWLELGGRLMSLVYKPLNRELLFNNPVFQPANLSIRNAWFAGGIEWNLPHYGHHFRTCEPVFAAAIQGDQGEPGLRLYDFDRCKGLLWQIDFYLPPQAQFLTAFIRVINPQEQDTSMYWWTNIAVPEAPGVRVLAPTADAIYIDRNLTSFGFAQLPHLPSLPGKDPTYSLNWGNANEFFFQCDAADIPWEAALDERGEGFIEASSPRLKYRKLFCWGTHQGGRHWQEFLAVPGMAYLEIQAGLAPTQLHHLPFAAGEVLHWTEFFGYLQADPVKVHDPCYDSAWRAVDAVLKTRLDAAQIARIEAGCLSRADQTPAVILNQASGWGALEMMRRSHSSAPDGTGFPAFSFPADTLTAEQQRWLPLLSGGALAEQPPSLEPGEWLVQKEWRDLLAASLQNPANRNWFALLHYGVMLAENLEEEAAASAWRESLEKQLSPWAYRNLAALAQRRGILQEALACYDLAWSLAKSLKVSMLEPLAAEYLSCLLEAQEFARAWRLAESLPAAVAGSDRVQILKATAALKLNHLEVVEAILQREFATVREGQVDLTNLWFEMWRRRIALETGRSLEDIPLSEVKAAHPAPQRIDFRSVE